MANSFTKTYVDGDPLLESDLDAGFGTVQPTLSNLALSTTGSTANDLLQSAGSNTPPAFVSPNTVAQTIGSTGANSIIGVVSSVQASVANLIGAAMTASGANAVFGNVSSAQASVSNLIVNAATSAAAPVAGFANTVAAARTRTTGSTVGLGGVAVSATITFQATQTAFVDVTNSAIDITTSGRPVFVSLTSSDGTSAGDLHVFRLNTSAGATYALGRDASTIAAHKFFVSDTGGNASGRVPASSLTFIDYNCSAGTHTYSLQMGNVTGAAEINFSRLIAYEL